MNTLIPVTQTRIIVPRRRNDLLTRGRLIELMDRLVENKLTIIAAPAGYGKTSLLVDFAAQQRYPVCWYSIDALDRDPLRFLSYFIAAIQHKFPKFGESSLSALQNVGRGSFDPDHLATIIVNDLYDNIVEHFVIMLDDFHLVDGSQLVEQFISRFIQDVDENCHIVIASRTLMTLPDFPLMVAHSLVGGLDFDELAFQTEEIQALYLQNYHSSLSEDQSRQLVRQTEGWITGLLLSAGAQAPDNNNGWKRGGRVSGVGLHDFLEPIFFNVSPELQDFLLRTALIEEFDSRFCQDVIEPALGLPPHDWDTLMDAALKQNLFLLPVGEDGASLRYHHLFRDFLQTRITRDRPDEAQRIQRRLAEVYVQRGDWETAHRFYRLLNDLEAQASLIEKAGMALTTDGRYDLLSRWLEELPVEIVNRRPELVSLLGSVRVQLGNPTLGISMLNQAITAVRELDLSKDDNLGTLVRALRRHASHCMTLGDFTTALANAGEVLSLTENNPSTALIQHRAEAQRISGDCYYQQGRLTDAMTWLNRSLETYQSIHEKRSEAILLMETGLIHQAMGDYSSAEKNYNRALEYWRHSGNAAWQANLLNNLGFLQHLRGDYENAAVTLERALQQSKLVGVPRLEAFALTDIGDLYTDLQAYSEAREAYRLAYDLAERVGDRFLLVYLELAQAKLYMLTNDLIRAEHTLALARRRAMEGGNRYEQALCSLETGLFLLHACQPESAEEELGPAVGYLEETGQQVDAARAHLYLSIAHFRMKSSQNAAQHLARAFSLVKEQEKQQPLVTLGLVEKQNFLDMRQNEQLAPLLGTYLKQVKQFEGRLPGLCKRLRQRTSVVPFAPPRMVIRALGRVQVKINDRVISSADWQVQNSRDLFFLMLAHPEGLSKESIGSIFWPDISSDELKIRFKNTIYRVRHAAGKDSIVLQDDYYHFNYGLDYTYDVEDFLKAVRQAQKTSSPKERQAHLQTAIRLYKGRFLPDVDAGWALLERERLEQAYLEVLLSLAELHLDARQYASALDFTQKALAIDSCLEAAHRLAMRIHASMGNRAAVARQYERCRKALLEEVSSTPSPQTQSLHDMLMR